MAVGFAKCLQCFLIVANLIILVCGIAVIVVGALSLAENEAMMNLFESQNYQTSAYILIGMGVLIVFVSFLGCCGALKKSKCMLISYFLLLLLIFILMLAVAILFYVYKDKVETTIREDAKESIKAYGYKSYATKSWDSLQKELECCGIAEGYNHSYSIWAQSQFLQDQGKAVPDSCCRGTSATEIQKCQSDPESNAYSDDCVHKMKDWMKSNALKLGGIGIGVACVLVIGMMLSCGLYLTINNRGKQRSVAPRGPPRP